MNEYAMERQALRNALEMIQMHRDSQRASGTAGEKGTLADMRTARRNRMIRHWRQVAIEHRVNMRRIRLTGIVAPF